MLRQLILTGKREHKPKIIELMGMHRDFVRIVRTGYHQRRAAAQRGMLSNVASLIIDGTRLQKNTHAHVHTHTCTHTHIHTRPAHTHVQSWHSHTRTCTRAHTYTPIRVRAHTPTDWAHTTDTDRRAVGPALATHICAHLQR